eukprot:TRINITY_DN155_c0_g1_i2.p1 TRINITY_DN155_c0_g1~~TRINITY_DN155_c0_g1_i2.p1  ORF type:complete len:204 (+),score=9.71 TRINITY_DN155_c0_g1_i2:189-800(+)
MSEKKSTTKKTSNASTTRRKPGKEKQQPVASDDEVPLKNRQRPKPKPTSEALLAAPADSGGPTLRAAAKAPKPKPTSEALLAAPADSGGPTLRAAAKDRAGNGPRPVVQKISEDARSEAEPQPSDGRLPGDQPRSNDARPRPEPVCWSWLVVCGHVTIGDLSTLAQSSHRFAACEQPTALQGRGVYDRRAACPRAAIERRSAT